MSDKIILKHYEYENNTDNSISLKRILLEAENLCKDKYILFDTDNIWLTHTLYDPHIVMFYHDVLKEKIDNDQKT